ncbi:HigA family addiction module antitoxin [Metabacillus fastidiosus]|uniref:HigA family addiction module antitoxin n=1 Tax=Metabacillus fastidiosus TaxID=1458 RepID=UPI002DBE3722|nr:HigA family addiction module antitoxin [Metabacillus fastidiosus]MEC2077982.1 HigA family addiction module antitoxin [Metabacillus fastidiosus]
MENNEKFYTSFIIPPGETLQEVLDDRNMSQKELALRTKLTPKHINNIIKGHAPISPDTAIKLENVLEIPASFWINLESDYQENLARIKSLEDLDKEREIADKIPYSQLEKKGWIESTKDFKDKIINLRKFFRVASLESITLSHQFAFRKSNYHQAEDYALISWLNESERKAISIDCGPYNRRKLTSIVPEIRQLTRLPMKASLSKLINYCSSVGIALVITPTIDKTHINGATKWISSDKAMIAMSPRGGYEDIFWFTFFHELGHVLQEQKTVYFIDLEEAENDKLEQEADKYAINQLISTELYNEFISKENYKDIAVIRNFAESIDIDMGIVIGRLMKDNYLEYSDYNFSQFRKKIPEINGN